MSAMKPVAPAGQRGDPNRSPSPMAPIAHQYHLARRALEVASGDPKAALEVLTRSLAVHPRKADIERAALRRAHLLAIQAVIAGTPYDDTDNEDLTDE